jgi:hypothetical protein
MDGFTAFSEAPVEGSPAYYQGGTPCDLHLLRLQ